MARINYVELPAKDTADIVAELQTGQGYVIFPKLITHDDADRARTLILDLADEDRKANKLITQQGRWRLRLVGRGSIFMELAAHDLVRQIAEVMLGPGFVIGGLSAHAVPKNAPPQGVHVDYPYSVLAEPFPDQPLQLQAIWVLDGFTAGNGPTRVLAHSQKSRRRPNKLEFYAQSAPLHCPPGSLILSHGGLWHDSSTNHTDEVRVAILGNYTPFWVRSVEGFPGTIDTANFEPTEEQRQLLGFNVRDAMTKAVAWKRADSNGPKPPY